MRDNFILPFTLKCSLTYLNTENKIYGNVDIKISNFIGVHNAGNTGW